MNAPAYSTACHKHTYTLPDTSKSNHGGWHTTGAWAIAALKPVRPQKTIPALVCGGVGEANDYATAVYVEVDPQRSRFGRRESECD